MTDTRKYLKPAEGRIVRREGSGELWPEAGDWTELTTFVRRRRDDGDLVETAPPVEPEAGPQAEAAAPSPPEPESARPPRPQKGDPKPEAEK